MTSCGSSSSGRSLALWTARSISPATRARSSAVTKMPSPIGVSGARRSPSETIVFTSTGTPFARRRAATSSLWTSARRDPRVPSRSLLAEPTVNNRVSHHRQCRRRGDHVTDDQRGRSFDACRGGRSQGRRHAWHDNYVDAGPSQAGQLFSPTPEDEWIAALQPNHRIARPRELDEAGGDLFLPGVVEPRALADVLEARIRTAERERLGRDECVVQNIIGVREELASLEGE